MNEAEIYEIVNSVVRPLQVDYKFELRKVLDEMEAVAVDPFYKTKIATHDNKVCHHIHTPIIFANNSQTKTYSLLPKFLYADAFGQILGQNDNTVREESFFMQLRAF